MADYTFDVSPSLDGYGAASVPWTGYWGKQGPELLDHRARLHAPDQLMVFGANTYRVFSDFFASGDEASDAWGLRLFELPKVVISSTLDPNAPTTLPNTRIEPGDAVQVVRRLKEESALPLRSHGRLSLNRALMAAGLVDRLQLTIFPVLTGKTGLDPIFREAADFDLELLETTTLDGRTQELVSPPPAGVGGRTGTGSSRHARHCSAPLRMAGCSMNGVAAAPGGLLGER